MEKEVSTEKVAEESRAEEKPAEEEVKVPDDGEKATATIETSAGMMVSAPKKQTAQERIDAITKARREAEREKEYWKRVALEKDQKPPEPPKPPADGGMPRPALEQFQSQQEYEDALFGWYERRKESDRVAQERQKEESEGLKKFNKSAEKIRQEYEDFDDVVERPVFTPAMRAAILGIENGPVVAYHLGRPENQDIAERIRELPIERQFYEIGKLESQLILARSTKKVTTAPAPINPVGITGGGAPEKPPDDINDWMKWNRERELQKWKEKHGG